MRASLNIPPPMVAYCRQHNVEPAEVAQFVLDEHGRECAEYLLAGESPYDEGKDERLALQGGVN